VALSPDLVGMTYVYPDYYEVGREKVREYAVAVKNSDAAYFDDDAANALGHDAILAPLTFVSILGLKTQLAFFEHHNIPITEQKLVQAEPSARRMPGRTNIFIRSSSVCAMDPYSDSPG
jgi:hypothetical protein